MATVELKLIIGRDHDTGDTGAQGMGNENFYGTVIPDHIGDNYAFVKSAKLSGTTLELGVTAEPIGVDKVIIAQEEIAVTYASGKLTGTVSQRIVDIFKKVNGNTDSATGDATPPPTQPPALTGIAVTGAATGVMGKSVQLSAAPVPSNAALGTIAWTSSDSAVATVDSTGKVTLVKDGSVTITATSGKVKADHTIAVSKPALTDITVTGPDTVAVGATIDVTPAPVPSGAALGTVTWASSDDTKATVDASGTVTGVAAGAVTITATSGKVTSSAPHAITVT